MKFSKKSSRRFFEFNLMMKNSNIKFEIVDSVLKIKIENDLFWMFRWVTSNEKKLKSSEIIKFKVLFSIESKIDEWLVVLKVFCVNKKKSTICCSKKIDVTTDVLKINIKERTTFDKNRERYFFLIETVDGVDVLLILK